MKIVNEGKSTSFCLYAAIFWLGLTFYASIASSKNVKSVSFIHFEGIDKVAHLILYAVFSFLWYGAFSYILKKNVIWYSVGFAILFGIAMEIVQFLFFKDRSFEVSDIIANIIGSFVGVNILNRIKIFKLC